MYEEKKYGITFMIDPRVELIFGMLSKLKKENAKFEEELDFIESFDDNYYSEYAYKLYEIIDFNKYPKLLKWAIKLSEVSSEDIIPKIAMMMSEDFNVKEIDKNDKYFKEFFTENNYTEFVSDLNEFIKNENFLEFFSNNATEYNRMIEESSSIYPSNMDVTDIEKYYGKKLDKYPVVYSIFFNGGYGPTIDGIPTCFKGLWIADDGKYFESIKGIINLFHEYSHSFINPLVDKYWINFENTDKFIKYSIENNLHKTYQGKPQILYYEYFVRAFSYIMASKYGDESNELEQFNKLGFVKTDEFINFINESFKIGDNFEDFFANKLIPFTNELTNNLEYTKSKK
ncbi:MAG: DUF4932 domain-containing protein [Bacilli bacterium]|nr:DUF4932 domain-containing protein [Bacilli bacterium]